MPGSSTRPARIVAHLPGFAKNTRWRCSDRDATVQPTPPAPFSRVVRSLRDRALSAARLERNHRRSPIGRGVARNGPVAARRRRHILLSGRRLPSMGKAALSERHLACVRGRRRVLPLCRGAARCRAGGLARPAAGARSARPKGASARSGAGAPARWGARPDPRSASAPGRRPRPPSCRRWRRGYRRPRDQP